MRKSVQRLGQLLLFLLFSTAGISQYTVKGKITDDARNEPLPNVSVQIKGTRIGTVTGTDGTFSLAVPDNKSVTLVISLVGFMSQSVNVSSSSASVNVTLKTDALNLEEVVVTGSYRASLAQALDIKRNSTTQVDAIVAEDIGKFPDTNLAESLQRITGVQVTRSDDGEGQGVQIRDCHSFVALVHRGIAQPEFDNRAEF